MKRKRVMGFSIALFVLLFLAVGSTTISAQQPAGLSIGLRVNADGTWQVVELFGQKTNLAPDSFNSMSKLLGLGFEIPAQILDPAFVDMFQQADIKQVALSLEGETARVRFNDLQMPQAKLHLQSLQNLYGESISESSGLLMGMLKLVQGTVYVRFTPEAIAVAPAAEAATEKVANNIHLAATVNPQGQVLSAGGFTRQEVDPVLSARGVVIPDLQPAVMAYLAAFDSVSVDVTPSNVMLHADGQSILELIWDAEGRMALVELAEKFAGFQLDRQIIDLAEPWLQSSHANVALHVADTPQDSMVDVDIGEPITVAFEESGLNVAGVSLPVAGLGPVKSTVEAFGIDSAQLCWQGTELRWLVNGMEMPYVTADPSWLTKTAGLLGWKTFPIHDKLGQLLAETEVPVALALDPEAAPAEGCGAYEVAEAPEPAFALAVEGTWNEEKSELALDNIDVPFEKLSMPPIGMSAQFRLPAQAASYVPPSLTSAEADVGPGGVSTKLDNVDVAIHWDSELLSNLANVADGFGAGVIVRQVAPILSSTGVSIDLESMKAVAVSPEAAPEEVTEEQPAVAGEEPAEPAEPAAETTEAETEAVETTVEQPATEAETEAEAEEQPGTSPATGLCLITEGDSLWTCWVDLGRSEGTGLGWMDWKDTIVEAYELAENEAGVVVVQPGDTIDLDTVNK